MNQFEIFFDGLYLSLVIFLGIRMLLINHRDSLALGAMTLLLGLGDSFHLVPRILANTMTNGFEVNSFGLFLGTRVSAITMSVFYLLFYFYIKKTNRANNKSLDITMLVLFAIRVATVLISFNHDPKMDLISNIPFLIMGLIDIFLLYKDRALEEFKHLAIYVFFSFLFYVPVVLFKDTYPSFGALMIPKTLMYILIVVKLYKNLKKEFVKKDIMEFAVAYLFSGILAGAVYRELGKIYTLDVKMAFVHTHLIVLGFAVSSIFYLLVKRLDLANKTVEKFYKIYNYGMFLSFTTMFLHGLVDNNELLNSVKMSMVGVSGIGHILITLAVIVISVKGLRSREVAEIK